MSKKFVSLLMIVFVLLSAAGCAPAATTSTAAPAATQPSASEAQPTATTAEQQSATTEPTATTASGETAATATEAATKAPAANTGPVVTLDYYWIGNGDTDQRPAVEKAINEYVEPLIGVNVKFHIIGWGDWDSKAVTALQAGEKIDIFFTADWSRYMQLATANLFTPLNDEKGPNGDLLKQYGQGILDTLNPAFVTGTQVNGINYAVPTQKELSVPMGFLYNVAGAEEIGFTADDAAKIKTMKDFEPWLAKWKAKHPDQFPYLFSGQWWGFEPWVPGFASSVPGNILTQKLAPNGDATFDETIVNVWETPEQKEYVTIAHDWFKKGYINPDSALTTYNSSPDLNAGRFFVTSQPLKGNNIKAQEMVNASGNKDLKLNEIYGQPKVVTTTHTGGSMLAIPAVSEYPVQAMKFINLMHTDSKLINMMLYGVEGKNWEVQTDGRVNILDAGWYGAHGGAWTLGDVTIQSVSNKEDPTKNKQLIDYSKDAIAHPSLGFRFNTEPVAAELTAVQAVVDGMNAALMSGSVDPAVELPKYIQALKDAGIDSVKAEVQKQYDEWKKTKSAK